MNKIFKLMKRWIGKKYHPRPEKDLKILVIKNRNLGDSLIGLSSFTYIKSIFSNGKVVSTAALDKCHLTYGLPRWIIPLYGDEALQSPGVMDVDDYVNVDLKSWKDWMRLWQELRRRQFDLIIELHQAGRTGKFFKLYSFFMRVPYYYHNHHNAGETGGPKTFILDQGKRKPAIQRDLDACYSILKHWATSNKMHVALEKPAYYLDYPPQIKLKVKAAAPASAPIIFGVVATRQTKMYPLPLFKKLSELILRDIEFKQSEILIPLSSSSMDQSLEQEILKLNFPAAVKIVKVPLKELPLLLSQAKLYIGNDTGLKHLCVALGIPTYTFFGPEEPLEWHPYDQKKHPYFFIEPLECRTRISHYCGLKTCDSMICLNSITPEAVIKAIKVSKS